MIDDVYDIRSKIGHQLFFHKFPHSIAPIPTASNANADFINVMSVAVEGFDH